MNGPAIQILLIFKEIGKRRNKDCHRYKELDDFRVYFNNIKCSQRKGNAVANGESRNKNQNSFPVAEKIECAEGNNKKNVIITVGVVQDMFAAKVEVETKSTHK